MARPEPRRVRWRWEAEDPEHEAQLVREIEERRRLRREEAVRREAERRGRRHFRLFVVLVLSVVAAIGYGVLEIARTLFG
jgi:hypothetical protein